MAGLVDDEFESFGDSQMIRIAGSAVWNSIRVISRLNIESSFDASPPGGPNACSIFIGDVESDMRATI